jgi:hypothetical protein
MGRFWLAMASLAAVGASAWFTLSDQRFRYGVLIILAGFAVKMWAEQKRKEAAAKEQEVGRE